MTHGLRWRVLGILIILGLLTGLFIAAGGTEPEPALGDYPGSSELAEGHEPYIDTHVTVSGEVIELDPVVIETRVDSETFHFTLIETESVEAGQWVSVFAVVTPDGELVVEEMTVREHWEVQYMFLVSGAGAVLILILAALTWRVNLRELIVEPRGDRYG